MPGHLASDDDNPMIKNTFLNLHAGLFGSTGQKLNGGNLPVQGLGIDRFDEMQIEACFPRATSIFLPAR